MRFVDVKNSSIHYPEGVISRNFSPAQSNSRHNIVEIQRARSLEHSISKRSINSVGSINGGGKRECMIVFDDDPQKMHHGENLALRTSMLPTLSKEMSRENIPIETMYTD